MLLPFVAALFTVGTLVGNALVCLAVLLVRKLKTPANFLLVSLAVADFFVGLIVMPLAAVDLIYPSWPLGRAACRLWTTADLTLCTASIVNLCVISVDRYLIISRPLRYSAVRTSRRMRCYIVVVWLVAALVSLSSLVATSLLHDPTQNDDTSCQVIQHLGYQVYATLISFYLPTLIMLILYVQIWRAAKRLAAQDRLLSVCQQDVSDKHHIFEKPGLIEKDGLTPPLKKKSHRPSAILHAVKLSAMQISRHEKSECKARETLGVIMSVFVFCWLPFFVLALLKPAAGLRVPPWLDTLTLWLGYSNSMLNPLIYCKYNKEFRVPFREMLCCRFATLQHTLRQHSFAARFGPPTRRNGSFSPNPDCSDV